MTITNRVKITISPLRLYAASSVRIPTSTQGGGSDVVSVSCFGVRISVMFHFMFVHYTFSSVWVAGWPPFYHNGLHNDSKNEQK